VSILLAALVSLAVLASAIVWFMRSNPSAMARRLRFVVAILGTIAASALLIFGIRFLPGLLPELFGLAGVVIAALIARAARRRSSGGFSTPGSSSQRTAVRTAFLEAWIDHASSDVGGTVLKGRFAGRTLDSLSDADLLDLHAECAGDADSLRVLESYLDRRIGTEWRRAGQSRPGPRSDMSREEALAVLGLQEGTTSEEIRAAHRRLIQRMHPDVGGTADLAARINRAKDVLLGL
jgi:hypothetical protein